MSRAELSKEELSKGKPSFQLNVDRRVATGLLLVVLGTVCFAAKSVLIKLAYEKGASVEATLLLRQLIATPLFWILFMVNRTKIPVMNDIQLVHQEWNEILSGNVHQDKFSKMYSIQFCQ